MDIQREVQRARTIRALRSRGWFIALMGVVGLVMYILDIAHARGYPIVVILGSAFCLYGAWRMFYLAKVVETSED